MIDLVKKVDKSFGWLLCQVFRRKVKALPDDVKSVAFIQLWGLGESLLTLPAIKQYSESHPGVDITVICTKRVIDVYRRHDFIDNILVCPLNPFKILFFILKNLRKFDVIYDFEEYLNVSALITFFIGKFGVGFEHGARAHCYNKRIVYNDRRYVAKVFCDLVGESFNGFVKLPLLDKEYARVESFFNENYLKNLDGLILLFPFTAESAPWRAWPSDNWLKLYREITLQGKSPIFVFGPKDKNNFVGAHNTFFGNVWELAALIEKAGVFVSSDTGPMHLAYIHGAKTVCLFGPNLPERWYPRLDNAVLCYQRVGCCPCIDSTTGVMKRCLNDSKCMRSIEVKEVLKCLT